MLIYWLEKTRPNLAWLEIEWVHSKLGSSGMFIYWLEKPDQIWFGLISGLPNVAL